MVDVSLTGTYLVTRAVLPSMLAAGGGRIVAFSSGYASKGNRNGAHYAAAKAGLEAVVKSVALEVVAAGMRVNAVTPGPVRTPMLDHIAGLPDWERDRAASIPMGRIGEADDLVGPVLFLLGPASRYSTGQVVHVNGGLLMP